MTLADRIREQLNDPRNVERVSESCLLATAKSAIVGFVFGGGIGLFLSSISTESVGVETLSARQQISQTLREMGRRSWSSAKSLAIVSLLFTAIECTVEKQRAKTDSVNTVVAGCTSGAILAAKSSGWTAVGTPKAALLGCAGFAAFSTAMEKFMSNRE